MNKKLLLSLGAPILTVLPFAAMVSCSTAIDIDTEIKRFNTSVQTKDKNLLAWDSAQTIQDATTVENKLKALEVFATVPKIAKGYELVIKSAKVNSTTKTTVDVLVSIHETNKPDIKKETTFKVEGFKMNTLETEAAKFDTPKETTDSTITSAEAVAKVNAESEQADKLIALKSFVDVPSISDQFGLEILKIEIDPSSASSVNVTISIHTTTTPAEAKEVTFRILGLKV
ncbi:MAG: hypothetical protein ACRCXE_01395 [Metamycoplasmataceae bacterium]